VIDNVVTFDELTGYRPRRDLGYVIGKASRQRNVLRSTFRSLGMLLGLAAIETLSEADDLRSEAIADMRRNAEGIGANAIVGVQFFITEESGTWTVTARGHALEVERQR
jgi:uncharacterized protein YbjQ (UPF0145 family)